MALYQIIVPFICLVFIARAISHFLRNEKTIRELVAWIFFWGFIGAIALFPKITEKMAEVLGIKSNVNAILFTMLGIVSYISFKLIVMVENMSQQITKLTRALALEKWESKGEVKEESLL